MASERPRILYIDDDPDLAHLIQRSLGRRGYEVENVASSEAGLKRLAAGGIDAIALDHFLPTGTGLDFLVALRDFIAPPPVVYVTAAAEPTIAVAALKAGATDYVLKTVGEEFFELLGTAIDQAVEKARLQRERDRAEREVREARDRAEMLLHEVNHRVANSLALVASMVALQARTVNELSVRTALNEIQGRITAIAGVHRRLYTSQDVRSVEISEYLASLLRDIEATLKEAGHASTVRLDSVQTEVPTDKAVSIGVLVTELVTNAFKYAYPDVKAGEIRVRLHNSAVGKIKLTVEDDGVGWQGDGPIQGTGVGSRIIQAMARGLGAPVTYSDAPGGCRVSLEFEV
ncbi:MAG: histidine kinase dimerization/phosphoacceptor domain -containing protein [Xanthobacteraceae bacterium]